MKRSLFVFVVAVLAVCFSFNAGLQAQVAPAEVGLYREGEVLVKFRPDVTDGQIVEAFAGGELSFLRQVTTAPMKARGEIGITHAQTRLPVEAAVALLKKVAGVEDAQPNFVYRHSATPNDSYLGNLWGMNTGFGCNAVTAWDTITGSDAVCVGIIDEGIQYNHVDLAGNMWVNAAEAAGVAGADDDGNGYVDDVYGWSGYNNSGAIYDALYDDHGTHVAGTVGAMGNNGLGVVGVSWSGNMISGKFLGPNGGATLDAIEVIDYMVGLKTDHGVPIVALNNSWGGGAYDAALLNSMVGAAQADILFVVASGNGNRAGRAINIDSTPVYPACYDTTAGAGYDSVICVTAIDSSGKKASFANYGVKNVDLGAPGVSVLSTLPNDGYGYGDGTSMATPHVTGAIALYAAKYPGASARSIKAALLGSVVPTASLASVTSTGGRLDVAKFLGTVPEGWTPPDAGTVPSGPTGLAAAAVNSAQVKLTWTDTANNETGFRVYRNGVPVATLAVNAAGYTDTGLAPGTVYGYRVVAFNSAGESAAAEAQVSTKPLSTAGAFGTDAQTKGSWIGKYGGEGYNIISYNYSKEPGLVTMVPYAFAVHVWSASTTDERALQTPDGSSRFARCYYNGSAFEVAVTVGDDKAHKLSLYCVDYDGKDRSQTIRILDAGNRAALGLIQISSFSEGIWVSSEIRGSVIVRFEFESPVGQNAVVSGIFLDDPNYVPPPPPAKPAAPSGLTAQALSKSSISLSWTDNSSDETGFKVYRSTTETGTYALVGTVGANVTSFLNTGLSKNTTYWYKVTAYSNGGESGPSNLASAKTPVR